MLTDKEIYGVDISEYAIENGLPQVKNKLYKINELASEAIKSVDLIIAKDVLEHIHEDKIDVILSDFYSISNQVLLVIPLGDNDKFRIREYEMDVTHVTKKDEEWWINKIRKSGYKLKNFDYNMGEIKIKWTKQFQYGNGFFLLEK
jgi:hypothetical protein